MAFTKIYDEFTGWFDSKDFDEVVIDGKLERIYDRAKKAEFQAKVNKFDKTSGINPDIVDCFKIIPGDGLSITRSHGEAILDGRHAFPDNPHTETLPEDNQVYYYIIRSYVEYNPDPMQDRCMVEGILINPDPSSIPIREASVYDLVLAKIDVPAGTTQITADMITDLRNNADYCGYTTIRANFDVAKARITADMVENTDTHIIPETTGASRESLRHDGSWSDFVQAGIYDFVPDGQNTNIVLSRAVFDNFALPISYTMKSGTIVDGNNALKPSTNTTYASVGGAGTVELIYKYDDMPYFDEGSSDIAITVKIKMRNPELMGGTRLQPSLYNLDTNQPINRPTTVVDISGVATVYTYTYNFAAFAELGANNIGFCLYRATAHDGVMIYGSDITVTHTINNRIVETITPAGLQSTIDNAAANEVRSGVYTPQSSGWNTIDFGYTFDSPPTVIAQIQETTQGYLYLAEVINVTTTGFQIRPLGSATAQRYVASANNGANNTAMFMANFTGTINATELSRLRINWVAIPRKG